jgi:hypothetical protein
VWQPKLPANRPGKRFRIAVRTFNASMRFPEVIVLTWNESLDDS